MSLPGIEPVDDFTNKEWQSWVERDQINLSGNKATARINAISSSPDSLKPQMVLHCNSRNSRFYINWGTEVGKAKRNNVYIDGEKFVTPRWNTSKNKLLTYYPKKVLGKVKKMLGGEIYSVEIEERGGRKIKAEFAITGINTALDPIRYVCEW